MGTLRHHGFSLSGLLGETSSTNGRTPSPHLVAQNQTDSISSRKRSFFNVNNASSSTSGPPVKLTRRHTATSMAAARQSPTIPAPFPHERRPRRRTSKPIETKNSTTEISVIPSSISHNEEETVANSITVVSNAVDASKPPAGHNNDLATSSS